MVDRIWALCAPCLMCLAFTAVVRAEDPVEAVADAVAEAVLDAEEAPTTYVGWIEIAGMLREGPLPFAWLDESKTPDSLEGVLQQLTYVRDHDDHKGVVIFLDQPYLSLTQCSAIADAIREVRDAGKTVMCFAEVYGLQEYLVASAADMILLQHRGAVELQGISVEEMYLAGMLEKIGVKPDLMQVGKYKGADEAMMRTGPSPAWDENYSGLLDDLYQQITRQIADGRGLNAEEVETLFARAWTMTDTELLKARAVDRLVDRDLVDVTEISFGETFEWDGELGLSFESINPDNPFAFFSLLFKEPQVQVERPSLAVVYAAGPITSGESEIGDGMFASDTIGSATMVAALEEALLDEDIKGVVLQIDSPGGSALASEIIWQSVREVGREKPVIACVGGMAASGGYYIVSGADEIYVQPQSILGSIGVVGGKITMGGLYDWAGIKVYRRSRGPNADLFNSVEPFTDDQRQLVQLSLQTVYQQFINRVTIGRGDRLPEVAKVAEGRLFTGQTCVENGMADHIGGVDDALAALANQLELEPDGYDIVHLPAPMSLSDYIETMLGFGGVHAPSSVQTPAAFAAARQLLGPVAWRQVQRTVHGLMQLQHESALLLSPSAIVIR